jgi:Asp/Glu/hydantoin racemase
MTRIASGPQQMAMDSDRAARPYRIALLNPNTSERSTGLMLASAWAVAPAGVHIEGRTVSRGQDFIADADALQQAAQAVLDTVPSLVAEGFDAVIVAGFGDPGVPELRRRLMLPVTGLGEAGIAEAAAGGQRYAIVTVTPGLHHSLVAAAHAVAPPRSLPACATPAATRTNSCATPSGSSRRCCRPARKRLNRTARSPS